MTISITEGLIGKKVLYKNLLRPTIKSNENIQEAIVGGITPSGEYIKLDKMWTKSCNIDVVEIFEGDYKPGTK